MKVTVYGTRLSPFVEKVVRGLQLKAVGFELVEPKSPTDLRKWNPQTGKMPVVHFDGEKVFDSTLILRRLDQLVPKPPLFADDPVAAANQRQLEDWADESLYWYVMAFLWTPKNSGATAKRNLSFMPAATGPTSTTRGRAWRISRSTGSCTARAPSPRRRRAAPSPSARGSRTT
ncbi:MAG: glutathione S-transferase family protein [Myxococcota bacterium]